MNELQIFNYNTHQVRTVERDGEPWFVLKDVCEVLGLTNHKVVAKRLDGDEVSLTYLIDSVGRQQETTIINESGLYNVILRSDKPEAKPFRRWVTSEVLPSIRRTGGYIQGQETLSPAELMAKALMVAQKTLSEREARISELTVENQRLLPRAEYFDQLVDRNLLTNFRDTAKQLKIKEKAFITFLTEHKYLYRDRNGKLMPYADKNQGLFEVKECFNEKTQWSGTQTLITPRGRETFRLLCEGVGA
nr:MAG TPA: repressor domain protein [Caudoviricetes sp.]